MAPRSERFGTCLTIGRRGQELKPLAHIPVVLSHRMQLGWHNTGMRVERCFAFADLCGFTRFSDFHGDEEAVRVLASFREAVREVATNHGIRVAKWLGDGAMLVGTDVASIASSVVELLELYETRDAHLPVRIGVAAGPVIVFEGDDYTGSCINLAARLSEMADANEVLATHDIGALAPMELDVRDAGTRLISGFAVPVEVVSLSIARAVGGESQTVENRSSEGVDER